MIYTVQIQNNFYDESEVKWITKTLDSIQSDRLIKSFICEWLQTKEMQNILLERPFTLERNSKRGNKKTQIINRFIAIVGEFILNQSDFTWGNYCKIMHEIPTVSIRSYQFPMRLMARNFYLYILTSDKITNTKVKGIIKQYSYLLLPDDFITKNAGTRNTIPFILKNINTYFPLDSTVEQMIQVECFSDNDVVFPANFFINTKNEFLYEIIVNFIDTLEKRKLNSLDKRIFITMFENSLNGLQINRFEDFGEITFKTQLTYYKSFFRDYYPKAIDRPFNSLVKFYRFIDDIYLEEYGERLFNSFSFNRDIITHMYYQRSLEEGYEIVNINSLGSCPESDKWFIVADIEKSGTHIANKQNTLMDFELVHNRELRQNLKNYIWNLDLTYKNTYLHFSVALDFLNHADDYYRDELKVLPLRNKSVVSDQLLGSTEINLFSNRFLIFYHASLLSRQDITSRSINTHIKVLRLFLKYIQPKYNIPSLNIDLFSTIDDDDEIGGNPIPIEDFKQIYKEFNKAIHTEEDTLLLIIFQLVSETKLRLGEVLGLERNCIESIDASGTFGTIQFYGKTTGRKLRKEVFMIEHIRLIQKAKNITQKVYENAESSLRKYVFIGSHPNYKNKAVEIRPRFTRLFTQIVDDLFYEEKIKERYTPNNLRHTFIERAWQSVEDGLISTVEVSVITGNTASVAAKHYRDRDKTKRYIEALYEVSIFDDELPGEVVDNESSKDLPPVQDGAGSCASESCIKVDSEEDSFYKCLTCKKFVTTIERSSHFEQKMKEYKDKKDNVTSNLERYFYMGLMELYGAYLADMYVIMGAKNAY